MIKVLDHYFYGGQWQIRVQDATGAVHLFQSKEKVADPAAYAATVLENRRLMTLEEVRQQVMTTEEEQLQTMLKLVSAGPVQSRIEEMVGHYVAALTREAEPAPVAPPVLPPSAGAEPLVVVAPTEQIIVSADHADERGFFRKAWSFIKGEGWV